MNDTQATQARPGPRWLNPRTMGGTVLLFGVGYAVWQPLAQALLRAVFGDAAPFATPAEWVRFAVVAGCVGLAAGAGWWAVQRMRLGWWREWGDKSLRMLALTMMLQARTFAPGHARWWAVLLATSAISGALIAAVARLVRGHAARDEPAATPSDPAV
jgi:hypothetical protein